MLLIAAGFAAFMPETGPGRRKKVQAEQA